MENYYNYFTEVERYYQTKRAAFTLLSTLDWVLIETWKNQGVPLETVLRGMDRAFSRSKRKISSLAYCANAVAEVAEERKDLKSEEPAPPEFQDTEVRRYLGELAGQIRNLRTRFVEFQGRIDGVASSVEELDPSDLRSGENALNALEEKLIAIISVAASDRTLVAVRESVQKDLAPFRSKMTVEQLSMLEQQLWKRKLMEHYRVPRLSLFYLI
jgi:hypothetical protein